MVLLQLVSELRSYFKLAEYYNAGICMHILWKPIQLVAFFNVCPNLNFNN